MSYLLIDLNRLPYSLGAQATYKKCEVLICQK